MIRVFRAIVWLSSIPAIKFMAKKTVFDKIQKVTQKVSLAISDQSLASHNSAAD